MTEYLRLNGQLPYGLTWRHVGIGLTLALIMRRAITFEAASVSTSTLNTSSDNIIAASEVLDSTSGGVVSASQALNDTAESLLPSQVPVPSSVCQEPANVLWCAYVETHLELSDSDILNSCLENYLGSHEEASEDQQNRFQSKIGGIIQYLRAAVRPPVSTPLVPSSAEATATVPAPPAEPQRSTSRSSFLWQTISGILTIALIVAFSVIARYVVVIQHTFTAEYSKVEHNIGTLDVDINAVYNELEAFKANTSRTLQSLEASVVTHSRQFEKFHTFIESLWSELYKLTLNSKQRIDDSRLSHCHDHNTREYRLSDIQRSELMPSHWKRSTGQIQGPEVRANKYQALAPSSRHFANVGQSRSWNTKSFSSQSYHQPVPQSRRVFQVPKLPNDDVSGPKFNPQANKFIPSNMQHSFGGAIDRTPLKDRTVDENSINVKMPNNSQNGGNSAQSSCSWATVVRRGTSRVKSSSVPAPARGHNAVRKSAAANSNSTVSHNENKENKHDSQVTTTSSSSVVSTVPSVKKKTNDDSTPESVEDNVQSIIEALALEELVNLLKDGELKSYRRLFVPEYGWISVKRLKEALESTEKGRKAIAWSKASS